MSIQLSQCVVCQEQVAAAASHRGPSTVSPLQNYPSVGQFLEQHGILVHGVAAQPKDLCCKCYALAQTCDELLTLFWSNVKEFRVNRQRMDVPASVPNGMPGPSHMTMPPRGPPPLRPMVAMAGPSFASILPPQARPNGFHPHASHGQPPGMSYAPAAFEHNPSYRHPPPVPMNAGTPFFAHPRVSKHPPLLDQDMSEPALEEEEKPDVSSVDVEESTAKETDMRPCVVRLERLDLISQPLEDPLASPAELESESGPGPGPRPRPKPAPKSKTPRKPSSKKPVSLKQVDVLGEFRLDPRDCVECGNAMKNPFLLHVHYRTCHFLPDGVLCSDCGQSFASKQALDQHSVCDHLHRVLDHASCIDCRATMPNFDIPWHIQNSHLGVVARTLRERAALGRKYFCCRFCKFYASSIHKYKLHMSDFHHDEKPFRCNLCSSEFANKDSFQKHCVKVHGSEPSYNSSLSS